MKKRILVLSNEAFSDSGSNSRTMKNLLLGNEKQNIAQFYLHGTPDPNFCEMYYKVSDNDALNAFLGKKSIANVTYDASSAKMEGSAPRKPAKSYRNLVLRNIVWQSFRWWTKDFDYFLDDFNPDIILLQAGDAPFMFTIARRIAKNYTAKLIMFNTEYYVLKKWMYASARRSYFWHFWLMSSLKKQYRKFMNSADFCIYNVEALEEAYQKKYPHKGKSCSLYTVSELRPLPDNSSSPFSLLYCGNLGVGRDKPLAELAEVLYEVDKSAVLDIYGKFTSQESEQLVCKYPNVQFHGFVDYSEIPVLMSRASMLVHCENNDRLENLRYAFSTKIADSLASTRPFLVYASRSYPFVQYLEKHHCAHIASEPEELRLVLRKCMNDTSYRCQYMHNAQTVASRNHNREENCRQLANVIQWMNNES